MLTTASIMLIKIEQILRSLFNICFQVSILRPTPDHLSLIHGYMHGWNAPLGIKNNVLYLM